MTEKSDKDETIGIIEEFIEKITLHSDHSKEEILKKITQNKEENKGMTDIGALYMIKNELGLDFSIKPMEQIVYKMSDEMIKRQKTLDYLFSIKGTALFRDNYDSIKALFSDVLQKIDNDPVYYDEEYFGDYSEWIIQIMKGTKLTEFIPVFLRKFVEADQISVEISSIIFGEVIELAKASNLMGEFFSHFINTIWIFQYGQDMDYYYDFIGALELELIVVHFSELLELADSVPSEYGDENYFNAFEALFSEIKDTKLIEENFSNLLKDIDHKDDAFLAIVSVIKEPELMKEKFFDVFALLDELSKPKLSQRKVLEEIKALEENKAQNPKTTGKSEYDSDYYYAYARLIDKIKELGLINDYFIQLEERLFTLLNESEIKVYDFSYVIESINGTSLLNKNLDYINERIENLRYAEGERDDLKSYNKIMNVLKLSSNYFEDLKN